MGGPLSCTMANFYMCHVENQVLSNQEMKPEIYCRFVDDIFVLVRDHRHLEILKQKFIDNSKLNFTEELSVNNKIPFLDVQLEVKNAQFARSVFTKPTKAEECLNFESEAPLKYKTGVLHTLLSRARKICNSEEAKYAEYTRIKTLLVNNNYPNYLCDKIIKKYKEKDNITAEEHGVITNGNNMVNQSSPDISDSSNPRVDDRTTTNVYYRNQYHENYKQDELALKKIIRRHVCQIKTKINVISYYKTKKTSNLLMKNNLSSFSPSKDQKSHVIYEFKCQKGNCVSENNSYIGMTTCSLRNRMARGHIYQGSIFKHFRLVHGVSPNVEELIASTKIIYCPDDKRKLPIYEALFIRERKPALNENTRNFTCLDLEMF